MSDDAERCACRPYPGARQFYTGRHPARAIGVEAAETLELIEERGVGCCILRCRSCGRLWQADLLASGGIYGDWDWYLIDRQS